MITVRYPNGFSVQYNTCTDVNRLSSGAVQLVYIGSNGQRYMAAEVLPGSGAIIEWTKPCRMYSALEPGDAEQFDAFMRVLREFPSDKLRQLKKALTKFDAKSWKGWKS